MKTVRNLFFVVVAMLSGASCCEHTDSGVIWGTTDYFSDFMFKKYEPVRMTQTLLFEFNGYARAGLQNETFEFEIIESVDGRMEPADDIRLYKNGEPCPQNLMLVGTAEAEVDLAIEFLSEAKAGYHKLFLCEKSMNGLDRIDYTDLSEGIYVQKRDVINPLKFIVLLVLCVIAAVLVATIVISHLIVNPHLKFSHVYVDYHDGCGERKISTGGAYKLVLTAQRRRISLLRRIFVGSVAFEQHEFWTGDLVITCRSGAYLRLGGSSKYDFETEEFVRKEPIVIVNEHGRKATVTTA